MKNKKILIVIFTILIILIAVIITNYIDGGRVTTNHEPICCIKAVSSDGNKVTYWGLGYKVIRYARVSPNEPYENNIGVKMGNWFIKYELLEKKVIGIELLFENKTITVTDTKEVSFIENILINSKYINELCQGISTYKIVLNNETYYIKEDCKEIQKGEKQSTITEKDLETIKNIIYNNN